LSDSDASRRRCIYISMIVLGSVGWFASWIAYAILYQTVPLMGGIPRQG
jgi:hypothetical protein